MTAALALATAVVTAQIFGLIDRAEHFQPWRADHDEWLLQVGLFTVFAGVGAFVSFISLLTWLSRSVDNTPSLGGGIARRGPRWAIGA
ncbi:MAG: hypothetical protein U9O18_04875, partial [Chloroflexota bacterium]|nr:hypothetical protein [Chloroflexota bacterium]